jgi:glutathione reductase (NADPH)
VRLADGRELATKHILIATGAAPFVPDVPGGHLAITSNEAFDLDRLPRRIVIVGGGYIAGEFAGIFNGLGSHVTLCYRRDLILRGFDDDIRTFVQDGMRQRGIDLLLEDDIESIEDMAKHLEVHFRSGDIREAGLVMYATGRHPNTSGLGLRRAGVKLAENGAVMVDEWSQTAVPSIYAVGDVTDRMPLTPVAIHEGQCFADTVFGANPTKPDHALAPRSAGVPFILRAPGSARNARYTRKKTPPEPPGGVFLLAEGFRRAALEARWRPSAGL